MTSLEKRDVINEACDEIDLMVHWDRDDYIVFEAMEDGAYCYLSERKGDPYCAKQIPWYELPDGTFDRLFTEANEFLQNKS